MEAYDGFATFYDASDFDRRPEIAFYESLVSDNHRTFLELGCGTGKILGQLAMNLAVPRRPDWRVVGVDLSAPMIEIARGRYPQFEWLWGDMTVPPVTGEFDIILCPFNALQQLKTESEFLSTLRAARSLLSREGLLIFDIYNDSYAPAPSPASSVGADRLVRTFIDKTGRSLEVREDVHQDPAGEFALIDWRIVDPNVSDNPVATLQLKYRHYGAATVERLVEAAGLHIRERYGDVRKSRFSATSSKKHIVVCGRGDHAL